MLVGIRKQASKLSVQTVDAIDLLFSCHDRIRRFTGMAERLAAAADAPANQIEDTAAAVASYFKLALPQHVADEDLSLVPRLHEVRVSPDVRRALQTMSEQHDVIELILRDLIPTWELVAEEAGRLSKWSRALRSGSTNLRTAMNAHLSLEEETMFPAMRRYLSADSEWVILQEMRARRAPEPTREQWDRQGADA